MSYDYVQLCGHHGHPMANSNGVIAEHRAVMSAKIGRLLTKDDIVHHKDDVKWNNEPDNLELTTRGEHLKKHHPPAKRKTISIICAHCGKVVIKKHNQIATKIKNGQKHFYCGRKCGNSTHKELFDSLA